MAVADGLNSLSLGEVAKRLGLSKSGVFSRIGSREALQKAVIDEYAKRFLQDVFVPAMREPRGLPRLNTIMQLWLQRVREVESRTGCLYSAGRLRVRRLRGPAARPAAGTRAALARLAAAGGRPGPARPATCGPTPTPSSSSSNSTACSSR